jgi:hypothetical protein
LGKGLVVVVSSDVRPRSAKRDVALVALGLAIGVACTAGVVAAQHQPLHYTVVEGWAQPNGPGTAISLGPTPTSGGIGYEIVGAMWSPPEGGWHGGDGPTCIGANTLKATRVRLDVVHAQSSAGQRDVVVAIHCLN